jgi:DNA-binding NtrC family response regulator
VPGSNPGPGPGSVPIAAAAAAAVPGEAGAINLTSLNVADAERVLIQHALAAADNNRTRAAELLGISVRTLRNKLNGPGATRDGDDD